MGKIPEKTIGLISLNPGTGFSVGREGSVSVSPTFASWITLTLATTKPTSPAIRLSLPRALGAKTPTSLTSYSRRFDMNIIFWRGLMVPSKMRTSMITPR